MTQPTKWRESPSLLSYERSRFHGRRFLCSLVVATIAGGKTQARVERKRSTDGGYDTLARKVWPTDTPDTVATAKQWCEHQADIATGHARQ